MGNTDSNTSTTNQLNKTQARRTRNLSTKTQKTTQSVEVIDDPFLLAEKSLEFQKKTKRSSSNKAAHQHRQSGVKTQEDAVQTHPELSAAMIREQLELFGAIDADNDSLSSYDSNGDSFDRNYEYSLEVEAANNRPPPVQEIRICVIEV